MIEEEEWGELEQQVYEVLTDEENGLSLGVALGILESVKARFQAEFTVASVEAGNNGEQRAGEQDYFG